MRFLFVRPVLCLRLPSDSISLATGAVLYFLIERTKLLGFTADPEAPGVKATEEH